MKEQLLRALRADSQYEEALKQYTKREGWSAVVLFGVMSAAYAALGWLGVGMGRSETLAVGLVTGVLFVLMHFPFRMAAYGFWIADLFLTHILLSLIYLKTNSLYGAILPHWVSNLAYAMIAR